MRVLIIYKHGAHTGSNPVDSKLAFLFCFFLINPLVVGPGDFFCLKSNKLLRQFGNYKKWLYLCTMKEQSDGYFCGIGWSDDAEWSEAILWEGSERTIYKRLYIFNRWTPIYFKYVRSFGNDTGRLRSV